MEIEIRLSPEQWGLVQVALREAFRDRNRGRSWSGESDRMAQDIDRVISEALHNAPDIGCRLKPPLSF
jgi:hypothetical protein